jgi:hypothetical protein
MELNAVVGVGLIGGPKRNSPISSEAERGTLLMCSEELKLTPPNTSKEFLLTLVITLCIRAYEKNSFELVRRSLK